ncbi:hypothetical protein F4679DRAFT_582531 [Xylaria curta]|nr:hypothetical protein F4679DRAFT_582531 [Xylaria curta]
MPIRKSSFLSDPPSPKAAKEYKQEMQIEFFKEIFTRYSTLKFDPEHDDDRVWALKGLEKRLSRAYQVPIGHGVLGEPFLGRSLLWQKAKEGLSSIRFEEGKCPPSWYWMGVKGHIAYLDAPYGQVEWNTHEIDSPLSFKRDHKNKNAGSKVTIVGELRAVARNLSNDVKWPKLILDQDIEVPNSKRVKCVIVGSDKSLQWNQTRTTTSSS